MKHVLVPLADGCEELEAITITDILTRAGASVTTAGLKDGPVTASRGAQLLPDTRLDRIMDQDFDLIVLPGGQPGADRLKDSSKIQSLLQRQHEQALLIAAVCAAPRALVQNGILDNRRVTAYPGALDEFTGAWIYTGHAVERDGHLITGRSPGVAMDFALTLVYALYGEDTRESVERALSR